MQSGKPNRPKKALLIVLILAALAMLGLYVTGVITNQGEPLPAKWKGINTGYEAVE
ncbi:hypothetical protein Rhal01_03096 [Rubritalea halochordaticola]|uniref:Uncharacterized protein n=1 Tax=Rubritalea halochordaticola TaxID=714537 RepID=A0ABP9V2K4_9BACT